MKTKIQSLLLLLMVICGTLSCSSQKKSGNNATAVTDMIEEQRYTFVAQTVFPTEDSRFNTRNLFPNAPNLYQLSSRYDLSVTPDSVTAFLPFFGRSFTAPLDPTKGGIKFTSTNFEYKKRMRKNNYEIEIIPKDNSEVRSLYLTISPSGFSSLRVISVNKTPIAFNGNIETRK